MKTLFEQIIEKHFPEMTVVDSAVDRETKMDLLVMERLFDAINEDYYLMNKRTTAKLFTTDKDA